jgi:hypothetical protein
MFDCGVNYLWVTIVCGCWMGPPSNALPSGQLTCTENYTTAKPSAVYILLQAAEVKTWEVTQASTGKEYCTFHIKVPHQTFLHALQTLL